MTCAEKLKNARRKLGKTCLEVSIDTGIGRSALANYECGLTVPRDRYKMILAKYYGLPIDYLFFEDDAIDDDNTASEVG